MKIIIFVQYLDRQVPHGEPGLVPGELGEELVEVAGPLHRAGAVAAV